MKKGLSLKEIKEIGLEYYVYNNGWYEYKINGEFTLYDNKGNTIFKDVDSCFVYSNGWYHCLIDVKITLYDNNREIILKDVDYCDVFDNHYEYKKDDIWYEKNFDGSHYKK